MAMTRLLLICGGGGVVFPLIFLKSIYHSEKLEPNPQLDTYNNDPDVFNIFRLKELAKIVRRTLLM